MEDTGTFASWQVGMTLVIFLAVAVFMWLRVRRSQSKRGEHPGESKVTKNEASPGSGSHN